MAVVQGAWNKLLSPGLVTAFVQSTDDAPIEYTEIWEQGKPVAILHKTYALGFTLSKEMLDDYLSEKTGVYNVLLGVPYDGNLHVYDLGDGMLVSCDLVRDLFGR